MDHKRVFVEKREDFNIDAKSLYKDAKEYLGIENLRRVRVVNIYDLIQISKEDYDAIVKDILIDGNLDYAYEEPFPLDEKEKHFRVEFLPSQYNQREDALTQAIKILLGKDIKVKHSMLMIFEGIDEEQLNKIKDYYINPVEMREISLDYISYREKILSMK